ncbi:MAG: histidine--tRNA ligase [Bacteroidota bacterium]
MSNKPSIPKGTRDFLPEVSLRREFIFNTIRDVFRKYAYAPIETPSMEKLSVLTGKYGEEGDRLIFKILNSGDFLNKATELEDSRKLSFQIAEKALRYDLTVPFARFVVMHQNEISLPFKRYQIQPVWRADRPQKGRYREFTQCDADVVGSDSLIYEAEYICIYDEALSNLGIKDFTILVNNRKILAGFADVIGQADKFTDMCVAIDKLDKIGEEGVRKELGERGIPGDAADKLFKLISFSGNNQEKLDFLEKELASSEEGSMGVKEMREVLDTYSYFESYNGTVEFNLLLARGLTYYTGTIYEVKANGVKVGSIGGGGRYANLTGVFGKPGLSGVGISFGADRIYLVMEELGLFEDMPSISAKALIINFGEESRAASLQLLNEMRKAQIAVEYYPEKAKMKKQFSYADRKGIAYTIMIGSQELESGKYQIKNMSSGEQESLSAEEIVKLLAD